MTFGQRLSAWLAIRGLSKSALAVKLGVSRAAVTAWTKHDKVPSLKNFAAICKAFGISEGEFWGAPPQPKAAAA